MIHPHQLHAAAALWSLRAAIRYLAHHRDAVLIRRPQLGPTSSRPRTLAELAAHDRVLSAERADMKAGSRLGLKPIGQDAPAPIAPGLVDLDQDIAMALSDATELVAYVHRDHPLLHWSRTWAAVIRNVFQVSQDYRWTYLSVALPGTPAGVAAEVAQLLDAADVRVRAVCGLQPDQWVLPLSPPCPTCRERLLRVQTSAPDSRRWTIVCRNDGCRCLGDGQTRAGDGCPCGMPIRAAGVRHIWAADSALAVSAFAGAALANRREAA